MTSLKEFLKNAEQNNLSSQSQSEDEQNHLSKFFNSHSTTQLPRVPTPLLNKIKEDNEVLRELVSPIHNHLKTIQPTLHMIHQTRESLQRMEPFLLSQHTINQHFDRINRLERIFKDSEDLMDNIQPEAVQITAAENILEMQEEELLPTIQETEDDFTNTILFKSALVVIGVLIGLILPIAFDFLRVNLS